MDRLQTKEQKETADLFRVYKNCHKMLKDRVRIINDEVDVTLLRFTLGLLGQSARVNNDL
jgi:hypothetical protein